MLLVGRFFCKEIFGRGRRGCKVNLGGGIMTLTGLFICDYVKSAKVKALESLMPRSASCLKGS